MNAPDVMHTLYLLVNYPVLATLARERSEATTLDGRACQFIYKQAISRIDCQVASATELAFMQSLGIDTFSQTARLPT